MNRLKNHNIVFRIRISRNNTPDDHGEKKIFSQQGVQFGKVYKKLIEAEEDAAKIKSYIEDVFIFGNIS